MEKEQEGLKLVYVGRFPIMVNGTKQGYICFIPKYQKNESK